jgi:hypothetical protein
MSFTIVSFYTENTPYETEVKNLIASLEALSIPHHICGVKNLGSWEKNCQHKARFILDAMSTIGTNIVWLDADAVVKKYPEMFSSLTCDIAYHYLRDRRELLSGTLFLQNNEAAKKLVQQWIELNDTNNHWDQKNLQRVVERSPGIKKQILPADYCKIYDNRKQEVKDPVITHYQASRRFKKVIGSAI